MIQVVVKSQILAGGRGLGTFKNGFKGGVHIVNVDQAEETASNENSPLDFSEILLRCYWEELCCYLLLWKRSVVANDSFS